MSILDDLKAQNPGLFQGPLGGYIAHGVFAESVNYPQVTHDEIVAEVATTTGIQVVVGSAGDDNVYVGDGAGDVIAFAGGGVNDLYLTDLNWADGWMMGSWSTTRTYNSLGHGTSDFSGYIFYNPETDQTIAASNNFSGYHFGDGSSFQLGPSTYQVDQLKAADQWLGVMDIPDLIAEGFLPDNTFDTELLNLLSFFNSSPQLSLGEDSPQGVTVTLSTPGGYIGTDGADEITATYGQHDIQTGYGNDYISLLGTSVGSTVSGGNQGDTILGGAGDDVLRGGKGLDSIVGGAGNDTIYSGLGRDTLTGGDGADVFVLRGYDPNFPNAVLAPTVTDFQDGVDKIAVQGVSQAEVVAALSSQAGGSGQVTLTLGGANIIVQGVSSLDAGDFVYGY
ncbi:calcium-binding protein [Oceanibaculum pacificum]|uniref:Peptidase M10 serralysin C-terminal domain-containing protein n=1 Tax=Oceanibaculum pacificum TaxID=580166 RepID=A0A154VQU0_9PROT|nr:calcium-binding protein [Oceanibaculum pacificum]KZD03717.1 hypothetical protein AUP43_12645 [Oceanibaculum pacificum]